MTALLYLFVGILGIGLGIRGWLPDRREPSRMAFMGLGGTVGISYIAFALSLLPGLSGFRVLYMAAGMWVPAFALWTVDRIFGRDPHRLVGVIFLATGVISPILVALHVVFTMDMPRSSPAEVVAGATAFSAFALVLIRLWGAHDAAELTVEKTRLKYLFAITLGAIVFTLLEQLARNVGAPVDLTGIPATSRGVVLQGALPPFSVLLTGTAMYFMYQALVFFRLLDLNEVFSRLTALVVSAGLLVLVDGVTVIWVGTFTDYPFHGTFLLFLASLLFVAGYDLVRDSISWATNRLFNRRGQQLQEALDTLSAELPTAVSVRSLTDTLLTRLHATGRVPVSSIYLWDRHIDAFALVAERGDVDTPRIAAVASGTFTEGFEAKTTAYVRAAMRHRRLEADPHRLAIMDAMHADTVLPMRSRSGLILGWLTLRAEAWTEGYSTEEIQRLRETLAVASTVLSNIRDFQALEEQQRLAALGAMAAGLAHEIRNPLAGIKGAAQFLQAEPIAGDAAEMLSVIVDETNRLNVVVSQFLDYARPDTLHLSSDHINALATHVAALVRAQNTVANVTLVEDLAPDLPPCRFDRDRLTQVLLNLTRNALQAMPDGGTLTIRSRSRPGSILEIAIVDTGSGITRDAKKRLFDPFFTTKRGGTGLGLAICERIVRAHGGSIDVVSKLRQGSTFSVRFPIRATDDITAVEDA